MLTTLLRLSLTHSPAPFRFVAQGPEPASWKAPYLGLYIHIPFCKTLCDFCPYNRYLYREEDMANFAHALRGEIELVAQRIGGRSKALSLYLGGGSPALALPHLEGILGVLDKHFSITGAKAIELHPSDVNPQLCSTLRSLGFSMVSLGVQSFQPELHTQIGRSWHNPSTALQLLAGAGFDTIDTDLLFGMPGQSKALLEKDFRQAMELGASQISAYPFIRFSYTRTARKLPGRRERREMLKLLSSLASEYDLERSAVWTFSRKGKKPYSSVTRENFIGFGPSATSLLPDLFKINSFAPAAYAQAVMDGTLPTALTLSFSPRTRKLYWLFWNLYKMRLDAGLYRELFASDLRIDFATFLKLGLSLGFLSESNGDYVLSEKGAYYFHLVEQHYTHQYIDKTWKICRAKPWPEVLRLY